MKQKIQPLGNNFEDQKTINKYNKQISKQLLENRLKINHDLVKDFKEINKEVAEEQLPKGHVDKKGTTISENTNNKWKIKQPS